MRPRKSNRHLPPRVYEKNGAFYYVHQNKWTRLAADLPTALLEYGNIISTPGESHNEGMPQLIDRVLAHITPSLAKNTVDQYRITARAAKTALADFSPQQVMPRHIAGIKNSMADTPAMANRVISFLSTVFKHAVDWQIVDSNPCMGVMRFKEKARDVYLTDDEFIAIRAAAHNHKALPYIMDICYLTSQRIGDVLQIKPTDITEDGIHFRQEKTNQALLIQTDEALKELIAEILTVFPPIAGYSLFYPDENARTSSRGRYIYSSIRDAWQRAREAAGITQDRTIHDIRAKAITDADASGMNATKLAGHSSARMTERYLRLRRVITSPTSGILPTKSKA